MNPTEGFLALRNGELRRTADGGHTWRVVGHSPRLVSLAFVNSNRGFALTEGQRVLRTRDGGGSWTRMHEFHAGFGVGSIDFLDSRNGWATLRDRIFRTTTGGRAWQTVKSPCSRLMLYLAGVSFVDARHGLLVCGGQPATIMQAKEVYASSDGGASWKLRACVRFLRRSHCPGRIDSVGHASGLAFQDARTGLLITERGGIARSADGGRRWTGALFTDDEDEVMAVSWCSRTIAYALLYHDAKVLRSDDAGRHWKPV